MARIKILNTIVINQIAAGEVVERPASIIKELVENSIDAQATNITVNIRQGGKTYICVRDNGTGMAEEDLTLALERHATSKIEKIEDIENIHSMGFRGEALPSIASIAKIHLESRQVNTEHGYAIHVEAGKKSTTKPVGMPIGTSVEVRDIFFATPARLKFLKADTTEKIVCLEVIERLALANPHITFVVYDGEKKIRHYHKGTKEERYYQLLGKDFMENSIDIKVSYEDITWEGYVSIPTYHQRTNHQQYFILNGRIVKDKVLMGVLKVPYSGLIPTGRHPALILSLTMPTGDVDINVHPAKTEVRFKNAQKVRGSLLHAINQGLQGMPLKTATAGVAGLIPQKTPMTIPQKTTVNTRTRSTQAPYLMEPAHQEDWSPAAKSAQGEQSQEDHTYPLGVAKAQLHKNWVVAQTEKGFVIVDQHAAHERLMHDKIEKMLMQGKLKEQLLLIPELVQMDDKDRDRLSEVKEILEQFGFHWEDFGHESIVIRAIPSILADDGGIKELVRDIVAELKNGEDVQVLREKIHEKIARQACHGSIRSGRVLTSTEMNALLREMESNPKAGQCSHGRPTFIEISLHDLEKLFKRR